MHLHMLPILVLIIVVSTISLPPRTSILQLPSQNSTILSSLTNTTTPLLGKWPPMPIERHFAEDTDILILACQPPSPSQPFSESSVVGDIRLLEAKVRSEGTRLAMMVDYHRQSGLVQFSFHGMEHFFRGSEIALILDMIAEMTNLYGAASIYGRLVKDGVDIAEFLIDLKLPESAE